MASPVAGIDPHQDTFTIGIVDHHGIEIVVGTFASSSDGCVEAIDLLNAHRVQKVGVEGSGKWGEHVSIALVAAQFDAREIPPTRRAQRRSRRLDKTDAVDALSAARALLAEPTLGPVQALEVYDPVVAEIEAVFQHRKALVASRTLMLHHVGDQITRLPTVVRDLLTTTGKIESRLRRLEHLNIDDFDLAPAGRHRLEWLVDFIDRDRQARREIRALERQIDRLLDEHGTTLRDEDGIGPVAAATLLCEVGNPNRFATESKFARWCGTGAVALSSGEGAGKPVRHRLDFRGNRTVNSMIYIASITQARDQPEAKAYLQRKTSEGKTKREARRAHKRHLSNRIIRRMWRDEKARNQPIPQAA